MVGKNQWINSIGWNPENAKYVDVYLHSEGKANTSRGDGTVTMEPQSHENHDSYVFDPKDPTPYLIDVSENEMNVPENYKDVDTRNDVLVYTSRVLDRDICIAGNIFAEIYASSSALDTDWVVRLEDVDDAGNSIRLVDGILRARYRNSYEHEELLVPGKIEKYSMRMMKTACMFKKGHKIRVTVTSGAKNLTFPNSNTGSDPADDTAMITATQKIYHGGNYPSHVKLPVISR